MHERQLDICALQYKIMVEKLEEIGEDVKKLVNDKNQQDLINAQVLMAIENINKKTAEQNEQLDNLKLFAWIGQHWKELIASFIAFGGLVIGYLTLKR
jgi:hypothetical protein